MKKNFVLTIGRQLGSGGHEIGRRLATELELEFYDKRLLQLAAEASGVDSRFFEQADEKPASTLLGSNVAFAFPYFSNLAFSGANCLSNDALFKEQSEVIRDLAQQHSAVFVGRCADYILRDEPNRFNLFIVAPLVDRIERIMALHHISKIEATHLIHKADKARAEYYNYYSTQKWGVAETYDLCVNSSKLGIDKTVSWLTTVIREHCQLQQE